MQADKVYQDGIEEVPTAVPSLKVPTLRAGRQAKTRLTQAWAAGIAFCFYQEETVWNSSKRESGKTSGLIIPAGYQALPMDHLI